MEETELVKILMKAQRVLGSKWVYYCITAVFLIVFGWKVLPYLVQKRMISSDLGYNLLAEIFGILFTLLVLVAMFELGDQLRWRKVKGKVLGRISTQLRTLFIQLTHFIEFTWSTNAYTILDELNSKESLKFSKEGMEILTNEKLPKLLENWRVGFGELEERYYRFLESGLELSLMEIQRLLSRLRYGLVQYQDPSTRKFISEDFQRKELLSIIHTMIHEISKIHELGLDFWSRG